MEGSEYIVIPAGSCAAMVTRHYAELVPEHPLVARGGKERLLARLGTESADAIDEFLSLALAHERGATPSLEGFLDWVERGGTEIKRDMERGRNEVRAQYAGIFLMITLACLGALAGYAPRQAAFIVLIVALGGCTVGRLASLITDRGFGGYNSVIRALFAVDTLGFAAASAGLLTVGVA